MGYLMISKEEVYVATDELRDHKEKVFHNAPVSPTLSCQ